MASASFRLSPALGETGGAAFVRLHSVRGRVSRLKLRRFSGVDLSSEATAKFLNLAFAVTGMTSSLATRRVNLHECFVFGDLRGAVCGTGSISLEFRDILLPSGCKTTCADG